MGRLAVHFTGKKVKAEKDGFERINVINKKLDSF